MRYSVMEGDEVTQHFAEDLKGAAWTREMEKFWCDSWARKVMRKCLQDPYWQEDASESVPGGFITYISACQLSNHREVAFSVHQFDPELDCRQQSLNEARDMWACDMGDDFDDVIGEYWFRVGIATDWYLRMGSLDGADYGPYDRRDSATPEPPTKAPDKTGSQRLRLHQNAGKLYTVQKGRVRFTYPSPFEREIEHGVSGEEPPRSCEEYAGDMPELGRYAPVQRAENRPRLRMTKEEKEAERALQNDSRS